MTRITGQQARDLLRGTTPGPWEPEFEVGIYPALRLDADDEIDWACAADRDLAIAAPALAETAAWLYGREPDGPGPHVHRGRFREYDQEAVASHPEAGVVEVYAAHDHGEASAFLTPDEAVDLARALLAAAEEARRDQ